MRNKSILLISPSGKGGSTLASIKLLDSIASRTNTKINAVMLGAKSSRLPSGNQFRWRIIPWIADYDNIASTLERWPLLSFLYVFPALFPSSFFVALRLRKEVMLVYGNGGVCGIMASIIAKLFKKKSIVHIHMDTGLGRRNFIFRYLFRKALSKLDYILANSRDVESDLIMLGLPKQKITVVSNWVDVEKFKPLDRATARKTLGFRDDEFILLYVGRFTDNKGLPIVLDAVSETVDGDTLVAFIGEGPLEEEVKRLAAQHKNVRFIGYIDDESQLAQYYNAADILAWGATDINYVSLTVMEALACGLPVLASNRFALKMEKVDPSILPSQVGFLIEPEPGEMKRMLSYLKQNKQLLNFMRPECRKFAEEKFGERNIEEIYHKIFAPLLAPLAEED